MALNQKVAVVTGTSSGIGEAAAHRLVDAGYRVFGTSRRAASLKTQSRYETLPLDVTSDASVEALRAEVLHRAGRIDLLVNNAGIGLLGGAEESSIQQSHAIFETNFFGSIRMIQAFLPQMRKQGSGRIINMSSVLGRVPAPHSALYAASKHAIEGYSESLDHEIRRFNIRSILIEPAFTKTNFDQNNVPVDRELPEYSQIRERVIEFSRQAVNTQGDPVEVVSEVIYKAATSTHPRVRYTAGSSAAQMVSMRRFLPEKAFDSILRKVFKAD